MQLGILKVVYIRSELLHVSAIYGDKKYRAYMNEKYKIKLWKYQNQSLGVIKFIKTCSTV